MKLMDCIKDFEKMVKKEIENVNAKGDLIPTDVKNIGEAVDILKDLYTIEAMKSGGEGYSQTGPMWNGNSYGNSYGRWMTPEERYARGGYSGQYYDENTHGMSYRDGQPRDRMDRFSSMNDERGYR